VSYRANVATEPDGLAGKTESLAPCAAPSSVHETETVLSAEVGNCNPVRRAPRFLARPRRASAPQDPRIPALLPSRAASQVRQRFHPSLNVLDPS
jgi:hypothetical protein